MSEYLCGQWKPLYDRIISLRGEAWVNKASLTPPRFIEVHVPRQESEWTCICVVGVSISHLSMNCRLDGWNCSGSVVSFVFIL